MFVKKLIGTEEGKACSRKTNTAFDALPIALPLSLIIWLIIIYLLYKIF